MRTHGAFVGLTVLFSTASACVETSTEPEPLPEGIGRVEFQLSGALNWSFSVTGPAHDQAGPDWNGIADAQITQLQSGTAVIRVQGVTRISDTKKDRIFIYVPSPQVGIYSIPASPSEMDGFRQITIWLNEDYPFGGSPDAIFRMDFGRIQIISVDGNRLRGTFSGTGQKVDPATGDFVKPAVTVEIRGGAFDVPIV